MKKCRFCGHKLQKPFLSLGHSPLSNAYLPENSLNKMEPFYPLEVYVCGKCFLVQLDEFEKAEDIFSTDYAYFSSYSSSWLKHCSEYVEMMMRKFKFPKKSLVVEIASNDGYLLQFFKEKDIPVLGIEPAKNTAKEAIKKGIPTEMVYFDTRYARGMVKKNKKADLIIGNNVLAHNPNLNDFAEAIAIILKPNGIVTMEFPHLLQLIQKNQFDTIYHEHFSYFSFYTVQEVFIRHGLKIFDVEEITTHGGSLRIYANHQNDRTREISKRIGVLLNKEQSGGLLELETYSDFAGKVRKTKRNLLNELIKLKNKGKKIIGYGAPAKGNTLLNYCGIRTDILDYTVDLSPHKQGKYLPGTHIPIKSQDVIKKDKPDYILILPWNIKDKIITQLDYVRKWGCKFITPIPKVKVIK